jgi:hypothetical protein
MQGIFGGFYKLTDKIKTGNWYPKKKGNGPDQIWPGGDALGRPRSSEGEAQAAGFEPARGPGWSAAREYRTGTGQARPSDQVRIDGRRSSSSRGKEKGGETLGFPLGVAGAHRGAAGRRGRAGGGRGGSWWSGLGDGEADAALDDGAVNGGLQVLRIGSVTTSLSSGPSQSER